MLHHLADTWWNDVKRNLFWLWKHNTNQRPALDVQGHNIFVDYWGRFCKFELSETNIAFVSTEAILEGSSSCKTYFLKGANNIF